MSLHASHYFFKQSLDILHKLIYMTAVSTGNIRPRLQYSDIFSLFLHFCFFTDYQYHTLYCMLILFTSNNKLPTVFTQYSFTSHTPRHTAPPFSHLIGIWCLYPRRQCSIHMLTHSSIDFGIVSCYEKVVPVPFTTSMSHKTQILPTVEGEP